MEGFLAFCGFVCLYIGFEWLSLLEHNDYHYLLLSEPREIRAQSMPKE